MRAPVTTPRWYHEPLMWLVVAIPALTVPAGLLTWLLASTSGAADPVADPVRRVAQVQTADLAADVEAARLGLSARVHLADEGAITVEFEVPPPNAEVVVLTLRHPSLARQDRRVVLERAGRHFTGRAAVDATVRWDLVLADARGRWRLVGQGRADASSIALVPALARS